MIITVDNAQDMLKGATITIFDERYDCVPRVVEFDTDTFLCTLASGQKRVAAGYVVCCGSPESLGYVLDAVPPSVFPFVFPGVVAADAAPQVASFLSEQRERVEALHLEAKFHPEENAAEAAANAPCRALYLEPPTDDAE